MNPVDVLNQIKRLTTDVIAVGICDEQNFPSIKSYTGNISEIGVSSSDNSIFLYGDNVFEKCGINRDGAGEVGKPRYFNGKRHF